MRPGDLSVSNEPIRVAGCLQNWCNVRHLVLKNRPPTSPPPLLKVLHASLFLPRALWFPVLVQNTASKATWSVTQESSKGCPLANWSRTSLFSFAVTLLKFRNLRSPGSWKCHNTAPIFGFSQNYHSCYKLLVLVNFVPRIYSVF